MFDVLVRLAAARVESTVEMEHQSSADAPSSGGKGGPTPEKRGDAAHTATVG